MARKKTSRRPLSLIYGSLILILSWWLSLPTQIKLPEAEGPPRFYSTQMGSDLRQAYLQAIESAKSSIHLIIYNLSDKPLIQLLRQKAAAGVKVHILFDLQASKGLKKKLGPKIQAHGRAGKGLMHQKVLILDQRQIWIGSANFSAASLRHHDNLVMAVDCPSLAQAFVGYFTLLTKKPSAPIQPPMVCQAGSSAIETWILPNPHALEALQRYIDSAKKTVRVAMFTFTHPQLADALIRAHDRGVDTQVVIDGEAALGAGKLATRRLFEANVPVSLSQGPALLHHKFVWIDGELLAHGSANWTRAAFTKNEDVLCIVHPLPEQEQPFLEGLWSQLVKLAKPLKQLP